MKTKINISYFICTIFLILSIFLLLLFFINNLSVVAFICFCISSFLFYCSYKNIQIYHKTIYDTYLSGNIVEIEKIDKNLLENVLKSHSQRIQNDYIFGKKQHPTFKEYPLLDSTTLPLKIITNYNVMDNALQKTNFYISKEVNFSTKDEKLETFLVDDISKRFAVVDGFNLIIKSYFELKSYELFNSSNPLEVSTQQTTRDIHTSIIINLKPNLQTPNITINFLNLHESPFPNAAYDIKGALDYIIEYNKNNPS